MTAPTRSGSSFQREEVDAAERVNARTAHPDRRGVASATDAAGRLVAEFPDAVRNWESFRGEVSIDLHVERLVEVCTWLRDSLGYTLLSDISPIDWLDQRPAEERFGVSYICTKLEPGAPRLRLRVYVADGEEVPTVMGVWPTADWHEREAWDFFGIVFSGREPMRRLLMDEDWVGHPLRKDYPIGGEPVKFSNSLREV